MMKKMTYQYLCLLAVLPLAMVSCSTENDIASGDSVPMTFTCSAVPQSRTEYMDFTGTNFGVKAKQYADDDLTASQQPIADMDNECVTKSGSSWSTETIRYWPKTEYVHFSAYAPYVNDLTPGEDGMNITLPQRPYQGYTFSGKVVNGRENLMFADEQFGTLEDFSGNRNSAVPMQFHHALTQVRFKAGLAAGTASKYKLNIKSLTLQNVRHTGSVSFTHNGKNYNQVTEADINNWQTNGWSVDDAKYDGNYTVAVNDDMTDISTTLREFSNCLYLLPQQLYSKTKSTSPQQITVKYTITTKPDGVEGGVEGEEVTSVVPLKLSNITEWGINKSLIYSMVMSPLRDVTLTVTAQPWDLEEFTNEFSTTVTVNSSDTIRWYKETCETYDSINKIVVLKNDITIPARFKFKIAGPLGYLWKASLVTLSGNPYAFTLSENEGPVGTECEIAFQANAANESNVVNKAELRFVVAVGNLLLPADALVGENTNSNYVVIQNINK